MGCICTRTDTWICLRIEWKTYVRTDILVYPNFLASGIAEQVEHIHVKIHIVMYTWMHVHKHAYANDDIFLFWILNLPCPRDRGAGWGCSGSWHAIRGCWFWDCCPLCVPVSACEWVCRQLHDVSRCCADEREGTTPGGTGGIWHACVRCVHGGRRIMYSRRWSERVPHLGDSYSLLRPVIMVYEPPMQPRTPTMTCTGIGPRHSTTAGRECVEYKECMGGYIQLRGVASQTLVCTLLNARASLFHHHAAPGQTSGTVPALIKAGKIHNGLNCERPPFLGASCSSIRKTLLRLNPPLLLHVTAGCELRRVLQPGNALETAHTPRRLLLEPRQFSVSPCAGLSVPIHHAPLKRACSW